MPSLLRMGALGLISGILISAASLETAAHLTHAGPPLLCEPFEIGDARSLPADSRETYPREKLVAETLAFLTPQTPVLVRMETVRRALLLSADQGARQEILCELQARVLDKEARGTDDAAAWFDAGYFAATWAELDADKAPEVGQADGCVGYAWVKKALAIANDAPEMEFGAAMTVHPAMHKGTHELHRSHLARAAASAAPGSLLETNLKKHCARWNESYDALKKKGQAARDAGAKR